MNHDVNCKHTGPHSDAAKRVSDTYNLHLTAGGLYGNSNINKVIACALADGRSDGTVYDSMYDAVRHQHHNEKYYAFIRINPSGMSVCEAEVFLRMERARYDAIGKLADREDKHGGYVVIPRLNAEDNAEQTELIRNKQGKIAIGRL